MKFSILGRSFWVPSECASSSPPGNTLHLKNLSNPSPGAAPNLRCHLDHSLQFVPLYLFRDRVSAECAREAALRAEAQILTRHVSRRRVDAALEHVFRFERRHFGAHQSEHDSLGRASREKTQRLEAARAFVVVFEEIG